MTTGENKKEQELRLEDRLLLHARELLDGGAIRESESDSVARTKPATSASVIPQSQSNDCDCGRKEFEMHRPSCSYWNPLRETIPQSPVSDLESEWTVVKFREGNEVQLRFGTNWNWSLPKIYTDFADSFAEKSNASLRQLREAQQLCAREYQGVKETLRKERSQLQPLVEALEKISRWRNEAVQETSDEPWFAAVARQALAQLKPETKL